MIDVCVYAADRKVNRKDLSNTMVSCSVIRGSK